VRGLNLSQNTGHLYWRFSVRTPAIFTGDFQSEPSLLEIFSQNSGNRYYSVSIRQPANFIGNVHYFPLLAKNAFYNNEFKWVKDNFFLVILIYCLFITLPVKHE